MSFSFSAGQHQAKIAGGGTPVLPRGKYPVILAVVELKPTRDHAQTGHQFLEASFFVTDGDQRGRKIVQRYNVGHSNPNTVEMAMNELACLSLAVGVPDWNDPRALTNRPFVLDIDEEERSKWIRQDGTEAPGGKQNRIIGYYTMQGADATTLQTGGAPAPAAAPSGPMAPPQWAGGAPAQVPGAVAAPVNAPAPTWGPPPAPAHTAQPGAAPWGAPNGAPVAPTGPVMNGSAPPWANAAPAQSSSPPVGSTPPWATPQQ